MRNSVYFAVVLLPILCAALSDPLSIFEGSDPDIYRNVSELITSKGYPLEEHIAVTQDGYKISLQHIPHGKQFLDPRVEGGKKVVLLVHGLFGAADNYVFNFPNQSLAFILADSGYDVWLMSVRGTTYSREHVKFGLNSDNYWDFSFNEMAEFDLPASIDYVLNATGQKTLSYVGHSQGTLMAFILLSQKPEYNKKVKIVVAMAPVAYLGHMAGIDRFLCGIIYKIGDLIGNHEIFGTNWFFTYVKELFCDTFAQPVCRGFFFELFGDDKQLNNTRLPVYASHFPTSTSTKNLLHFSQLVSTSTFRKFDYGQKGNMAHYGQATPPDYDVSKISAPVALLWSMNDTVATPEDVAVLRGKLHTVVDNYQVPYDGFLHVDYVIAMEANTLVYNEVLKLLKKY